MASLAATLKERYLTNPAGDFAGGVTAAIVALPLALAFGVSSGLGAESGLYGAIASGIVAALFGGTRGQVSGPTGPMTVVVATMLAAASGRAELVFAAVILGGILQVVLGRMRAGQLIHYTPYPVISGFMTGIGLIIVCLQIAPFIGHPATGQVLDALAQLPGQLPDVNHAAMAIGGLVLLIIYGIPLVPVLKDRLPPTLTALVVATLVSLQEKIYVPWLALAGRDPWVSGQIPVIGSIHAGFPAPHLPHFAFSDLHLILTSAISLAILGALDSLLTSVVVDKMTGSRHKSDQELIGQGIGNITAGLFGGLPGAGATMRSVVCLKSGGSTHLSGAIHGVVLLAVLMGLGKIAALIPLSCLAGILISVGIGIMDYRGLASIGKASKSDVFVMLVVLFLTVFVDLVTAVGIGVILACTLFAKKLSDASLSELNPLASLEHLRKAYEHLPREAWKSIYTYTFNGPLFFGEVKNFTESVSQLSKAKYIILRFSNVPIIDQTGAYALEDAVTQWESRGIKVFFVGLQDQIQRELEDIGIIHKIDMGNCFQSIDMAIEAIDRYFEEVGWETDASDDSVPEESPQT